MIGRTLEQLRLDLVDLELKDFQIQEVYRWLYKRRHWDPLNWTNLPKIARPVLVKRLENIPHIATRMVGEDSTTKYAFSLADGKRVEAVWILEGSRRTLCISSQVGCPIGCPFCLTGTMGLIRNLEPGEIVSQVLGVLDDQNRPPLESCNIVFMGMGEPLLNPKGLHGALDLLLDPEGMGISRRRITVSTSGCLEALKTLAQRKRSPKLAFSLHSARDEIRKRLVPNHPGMDAIRLTLRNLPIPPRERITLEVVLLKGINDSEKDCRSLVSFCEGLKVKINLIPHNPNPELELSPPPRETVLHFQTVLLRAGVATTIRESKGGDIAAACGQLALSC